VDNEVNSFALILPGMRISPDTDDSPEFIALVEQLCLGVVFRFKPKQFVIIKIDNWFGSKWLGFSGKALGAVGRWDKPHDRPATEIRIPPFVPNRVISQRRFSAPSYDEVNAGKPIHKQIPSSEALLRKAALHAPQTALAWYSGNSIASARGALMVYIPNEGSYWPWYAGWEQRKGWRLIESWDITPEQIEQLSARVLS
jgi:hypothetical protein